MSARRHPIALAALVALSGCALSGCGLSIDEPPSAPSNTCGSDGECGANRRCHPELHLCYAEPAEAYAYTVQVVLPASADEGRPALVTAAGPLSASRGDASAELLVRHPVPVVGSVRVEGTPIEADVIFAPRARTIVPTSPRVAVSTPGLAALGGGTTPREHDFATYLVPGTTYDVEVRPRGSDARRLAPFRHVLELDQPQRHDITLRAPADHFRLAGTLVDLDGRGQGGLEVRAIDASGRLVSSIATTTTVEGVPGHFELFVDPEVTGWVLRVSAAPGAGERAAFPTITVDPSALVYEGPVDDPLVRVLVPSPESGVCFAGTVEHPAELGGGPALGATITLRSRALRADATGLAGSYSIQLTSDPGAAGADLRPIGCSLAPLPPGGFQVRVLPGEYDLEVRPIEPMLGVHLEHRTIEDDTVGPVIELPARGTLSGMMQRSAGEPVFDARVRAVPLNVELPGRRTYEAARLNRPNETITDPHGNFRLPLDVGVYDLIAEPPEGSGFPWVVRPAFAMAAREWTEVIDVRQPIIVRGSATYDDGTPVAGAELSAYAVVGEPGAERPVPIGRAVTDEHGEYVLLLPVEPR